MTFPPCTYVSNRRAVQPVMKFATVGTVRIRIRNLAVCQNPVHDKNRKLPTSHTSTKRRLKSDVKSGFPPRVGPCASKRHMYARFCSILSRPSYSPHRAVRGHTQPKLPRDKRRAISSVIAVAFLARQTACSYHKLI